MKPLVSVVVTTYNRSNLLKRALESVLNQTYSNIECIVVDDASTDNTKEVVSQYVDKGVIYKKHVENRHLSAARNTGIGESNGQFIAFLDDDDEWRPTKIEKQIAVFKQTPKIGLVYCWMNIYDFSGKKIKERHPKLRGNIFSKVLETQPLGNGSTFLIRADAIKKIGYFDEEMKRGIDGDYVRRLSLRYKIDYVPEVLVNYYVNHGNERITSHDKKGIQKHILGQKSKISKFKHLMDNYPKQHSTIIADIAFHQGVLGEYEKMKFFFLKAIRIQPWNFKIYLKILKLLNNLFIKRN